MEKLLINSVLILLVIIGGIYDIRTHKIPNILTFPGITIGLLFNIIFKGFGGFTFSLFGLVTGLALFFIPFALGLMGAGDVKLLAAIGSLMGWRFTVLAALFSAIAGLFVVFIFLIYKKKLFAFLKKYGLFIARAIVQFLYFCFKIQGLSGLSRSLDAKESEQLNNEKLYVPYGVAIALGTLFTLSGLYKDFLPF